MPVKPGPTERRRAHSLHPHRLLSGFGFLPLADDLLSDSSTTLSLEACEPHRRSARHALNRCPASTARSSAPAQAAGSSDVRFLLNPAGPPPRIFPEPAAPRVQQIWINFTGSRHLRRRRAHLQRRNPGQLELLRELAA
jgi:hypothetical protein